MNEPAISIRQPSGPARPVALNIEVGSGTIEIRTDPTRPAAVRAEPVKPNDPVALDLIKRARLVETSDRLSVAFPDPPSVQGVSIGNMGRSFSSVTISGGDVVINGERVSGGSLRVTAIVPPGSLVTLRTQTADATLVAQRDEITEVTFNTTSGDLHTEGASHVHATTVSGDVEADEARGSRIKTTSGDIDLTRLRGDVSLNSISGDIDAHCMVPAIVLATTISGDIKVTSEPGVRPDVRPQTVSGKTRVR